MSCKGCGGQGECATVIFKSLEREDRRNWEASYFLRELERRAVVVRLDVERRDVALRPRVIELVPREDVLIREVRLDDDAPFRLRAGLRFLPPPVSLLTVAHALRADSRPPRPRFS